MAKNTFGVKLPLRLFGRPREKYSKIISLFLDGHLTDRPQLLDAISRKLEILFSSQAKIY